MDKFIQSMENILTWLQPAAWVLVAVAVVGCAIGLSVGGEESRTKAKKRVPYIALGVVLFLLAVYIGKDIVQNVVF